MFLGKKNLWWNHEVSSWFQATFLFEAVEASLCYFFENWLQISKYHNLRHL
jgi:hypothetical protein